MNRKDKKKVYLDTCDKLTDWWTDQDAVDYLEKTYGILKNQAEIIVMDCKESIKSSSLKWKENKKHLESSVIDFMLESEKK
jgi:predicted metalloendopeptidase